MRAASNNEKIATIHRSAICLHSHCAAAMHIAKLASKLSTSLPSTSYIPSTVHPAVHEAYVRALCVIGFNKARKAAAK